MEKITIVTELFDITKYSGNIKRRPITSYIAIAQNIPNANVVCFTEPDLIDKIKEKKNAENLTIISSEFKDLESVKLYGERIKKLTRFTERNHGMSNMYSNEFYLVIWNKFWCLKHAIENNYYNTEYFAWVDYGINHIDNNTTEDTIRVLNYYVKNLTDKIGIMINNKMTNETDVGKFFMNNVIPMMGSLVVGKKENVLWLAEEAIKLLPQTFEKNVCGSDEVFYGYLINKYPERFDYSYGNYINHLCNIPNIKQHEINHIINNILKHTTNEYIFCDLCKKIYNEVIHKELVLAKDDLIYVLTMNYNIERLRNDVHFSQPQAPKGTYDIDKCNEILWHFISTIVPNKIIFDKYLRSNIRYHKNIHNALVAFYNKK